MDREKDRAEANDKPANDNAVSSDGGKTIPDASAEAALAADRINLVVLDIARLIGRQIAREDFKRRTAANDDGEPEGGRGGD